MAFLHQKGPQNFLEQNGQRIGFFAGGATGHPHPKVFPRLFPGQQTREHLHAKGLEGELIDEICFGCVFTFAGFFTQLAGAQIPEGFDMQVTGSLKVDETVSTEQTSWSRVKSLFN